MSKRLFSQLLLLALLFPSIAPYATAQETLATSYQSAGPYPTLSVAGSGQLAATAPNAEIAAVLSTAVQVAAGSSHTCALTSGGGVKCWGNNGSGQVGDGTTRSRNAPEDGCHKLESHLRDVRSPIRTSTQAVSVFMS